MKKGHDAVAILIMVENEPEVLDNFHNQLTERKLVFPSMEDYSYVTIGIADAEAQGADITIHHEVKVDLDTAIECYQAIRPIIERRRKEFLGDD